MKITKDKIEGIVWYVEAQNRYTQLLTRTVFLSIEDAIEVYPSIENLKLTHRDIYTNLFRNNVVSCGKDALIILPVDLYKKNE